MIPVEAYCWIQSWIVMVPYLREVLMFIWVSSVLSAVMMALIMRIDGDIAGSLYLFMIGWIVSWLVKLVFDLAFTCLLFSPASLQSWMGVVYVARCLSYFI